MNKQLKAAQQAIDPWTTNRPGVVIGVEFVPQLVAKIHMVDGRCFELKGAEAERIERGEVRDDQDGSSPEEA